MAKLTDAQLQRKDLVETIRTLVRLKHNRETRRELNEIESRVLAEFDRRVATGQPYTPDLAELVMGELE